MGRFTGKSDFEDWCEMHNNPQEVVDNFDIYIDGNKLDIKTTQDLIPYYPHLTVAIYGNKTSKGTIILSEDSYIDEEEDDAVELALEDIIIKYKKYKRLKKALTIEDFKEPYYRLELYQPLLDAIEKNPIILKFPYSRKSSWRDRQRILHMVRTTYCKHIHTLSHTARRKEFLEFATNKGFMNYLDVYKAHTQNEIANTLLSGRADHRLLNIAGAIYEFEAFQEAAKHEE